MLKSLFNVKSLCKTFSWRVTAGIDTAIISWVMTGSLVIGLGIAGLEAMTKLVWYYVHEQVWNRVEF